MALYQNIQFTEPSLEFFRTEFDYKALSVTSSPTDPQNFLVRTGLLHDKIECFLDGLLFVFILHGNGNGKGAALHPGQTVGEVDRYNRRVIVIFQHNPVLFVKDQFAFLIYDLGILRQGNPILVTVF